MAKVIFEYDPFEDASDLQLHINAHELLSDITEFEDWLRTQRKHTDLSVAQANYLQLVTDTYYKIMQNSKSKLES